jgi:hypothetical protein
MYGSMEHKQEILTELKEAYNDCNSLFDMAQMFNNSMFTRTEFTRKVANTMDDVMKALRDGICNLEGDRIWLTKEKYDRLLEYKHMYEDLCD